MKFMTKADSLNQVNEFCHKQNYSVDRLLNLTFDVGYPESAYVIPSKVIPDGLMNDLDTMPIPILFIIKNGNEFIIEETEYTKPYFNGELDYLL